MMFHLQFSPFPWWGSLCPTTLSNQERSWFIIFFFFLLKRICPVSFFFEWSAFFYHCATENTHRNSAGHLKLSKCLRSIGRWRDRIGAQFNFGSHNVDESKLAVPWFHFGLLSPQSVNNGNKRSQLSSFLFQDIQCCNAKHTIPPPTLKKWGQQLFFFERLL